MYICTHLSIVNLELTHQDDKVEESVDRGPLELCLARVLEFSHVQLQFARFAFER